MRLISVLVAFHLAAACTDFNSPSELGDVQLLAVRASPKGIAGGERARLDFLIGGPGGLISGAEPLWLVTDGLGTPAVGSVVLDAGEWFYQAPASVPEPSGVTLTLLVEAGGVQLNALKAIGIGVSEDNPTIADMVVSGQSVEADGDSIAVAGETFEVSARIDPDPGETGQLAWYSTIGVADPIRGPVVTIEVDSERDTAQGPLVVVGRDGFGGIAWKTATLSRE